MRRKEKPCSRSLRNAWISCTKVILFKHYWQRTFLVILLKCYFKTQMVFLAVDVLWPEMDLSNEKFSFVLFTYSFLDIFTNVPNSWRVSLATIHANLTCQDSPTLSLIVNTYSFSHRSSFQTFCKITLTSILFSFLRIVNFLVGFL